MTDISEETPNPVTKTVEANQLAEAALTQAEPNIELAQAWAAVAANWVAMVDVRSPEVRRMTRPPRPPRP